MHVLILENRINIDNLVLKLKQNKNIDLIFASQDAICSLEAVTKIPVESDEVSEVLDFVLANEIGFVFVLSSKAQSTEIIELLEMNSIQFFGSSQEQFEYLLSRANTKKMIYKNKIPTTKYSAFEKQSMAIEWCRNAEFPIEILTDLKDEIKMKLEADTFLKAQKAVDEVYDSGYNKVLLQEVVDGLHFSSYFLTDSSSHIYLADFYKEGNLTICPDYRISSQLRDEIYRNYYLKILNSLNYGFKPFCGVLKFDFILDGECLYLNDVASSFKPSDFQIILEILDVDVFNLFSSLSTGALEDFEGCNLLKNEYVASISVAAGENFEENECVKYIKINNEKTVKTAIATTVNRSCEYLNEM